jgi:hypothetical protein
MYNSLSDPTITNTTFSENTANHGGGMYNSSSSPTITNTTFSENTATSNGGGMRNFYSSSPTIANSIFWGNIIGTSTTAPGSDIQNRSGCTPTITYTTLQVAYTGTSNSTADPLFVDASNPAGADGIHRTADDGLRLVSTSPALGAGNNDSIPSGITADIIGADRIQGTTVDMGAYEGIGGGVCLNAKVYLQGALLLSSTSTMTTDLNTAGVLPTTEPYTALSGFTHSGDGGGETTTTSILTSANIVDWVFIELRDKTTSTTVVETYAALLKSDGTIVSPVDGTSGVCFDNLLDPEVYVSVRHRNHLGVMAASTVSLSSTGTTVDFSTATLYGTNAATTTNSVTALWVGDVNQDGGVKFQGSSNDATIILNEVLGAAGNTGAFGSGAVPGYTYTDQYSSSDINLDGDIKFQGSSNDVTIILNNIIAYPANTGAFGSGAVPGYSNMNEQLP